MQHKKLNKENVLEILPLTTMQKSMLFLHMMMPDSKYYLEQQVYTIHGVCEENVVIDAWKYVVMQNASLRTLFRWVGLENPIQIILGKYQVPLHFQNVTHLSYTDRESYLSAVCQKEWSDKLDIAEQPLKVLILKVEENVFNMILTYHHIILDGWSNAILMQELCEALKIHVSGRMLKLRQKVEYKEYIKWVHQIDKEPAARFWMQYLKNYKNKSIEASYETMKESSPCYYEYPIKENLGESIKEYARKNKVTPASVFYAAWGMILSEIEKKQDILFGITVSGRPPELAGVEETVGLFIHTVPIRFSLVKEKSIAQLVKEINNDLIQIQKYQYIPFNKTFSQLAQVEGRLFDSVVTIQNYPVDDALARSNETVSMNLIKSRYVTDLKITLGIKLFSGHHQIDFCYNSQLVDSEYIRKTAERYRRCIKYITKERKS